MSIGLERLKEKYNLGNNFFRTILCRPEFNQFRTHEGFFIMDDSIDFHKILKSIIDLKKKSNKYWRNRYIILLFLLLNTQIGWCQHYEPIIIYSPSGEPQSMIKNKILYNSYGLPKKYINRTMDKE